MGGDGGEIDGADDGGGANDVGACVGLCVRIVCDVRMSVGLCVRIECGIMCENLLSDDVITKKVSFL